MSSDKCKSCDKIGQVNVDGQPICVDCPDFTSSAYLDDMVRAVAAGDVDPGDNDIVTEYIKYKSNPTPKKDPLGKFSWLDRKALWLTGKVGTIRFTIACAVLVTIPLIIPATMPVIGYISSGYLQLVLLPLIMVGTNLQGIASEVRSENNYELIIRTNLEVQQILHELEHIKQIMVEGKI